MTKLQLPQLSMRVLEFVVPVLHFVLGLPGMTRALERFGGDPGKGIGMGSIAGSGSSCA